MLLHNLLLATRAGALYISDQMLAVDLRPTIYHKPLLSLLSRAAVSLQKDPNVIKLILGNALPGVVTLNRRKWVFSKEATDFYHSEKIYVIGDLHGNYSALIILLLETNILFRDDAGFLSINQDILRSTRLVFLGDYVDRMSYSIEIIAALCYLRLLSPDNIILLRGNHETIATSMGNTTHKELCVKYGREYGGNLYKSLIKLFYSLPIACLINSIVLCVHGGIHAPKPANLNDLESLNRFREPRQTKEKLSPYYDPLQNLLWSDYIDEEPDKADKDGVCYNLDRATGILYGPSALRSFLNYNNLSMLIRGHECVQDGFLSNEFGSHNTVFSSPLYDDKNSGAIMLLMRPAEIDIPISYKPPNPYLTQKDFIATFSLQYSHIFQHDTMRVHPFILARSTGLIPVPQQIYMTVNTLHPREPITKQSMQNLQVVNTYSPITYDSVLCLDGCLLDLPLDHVASSGASVPVYEIQGCDGSSTVTISSIRRFIRLLSELCSALGLPNYTVLSSIANYYQWLVAPNGYRYNCTTKYMLPGTANHYYLKIGERTICIPRVLSQPIFPLKTLMLLITKSEENFMPTLVCLSQLRTKLSSLRAYSDIGTDTNSPMPNRLASILLDHN